MRIVNTKSVSEESWSSPKGKFRGAGREISIALGRDPSSANANDRHPFDVEILRIPADQTPYPYHSHAAQWEFYHVISGKGIVRDNEGMTLIEAGDAFIFPPDKPHQLSNNSSEDLIVYVIADNPTGESCYYPDSEKWLVRSPKRTLIGGESLEYYDGEE